MKHKHADVIRSAELLAEAFPHFSATYGAMQQIISYLHSIAPIDLGLADEQTDNHTGICLEVEA